MISGAHVILYSTDAEKDRAFFRDVLSLGHVDVGGGWLIFGFPPSELAVHPASANGTHELYLMCDDVNAFIAQMQARGIECSAVESLGWGQRTQIRLPGGGQLGVYQPRHARPQSKSSALPRAKRATAKSKASRPKRAKSRPANKAKKKGKAARRRS
jgi:hypothetical protein